MSPVDPVEQADALADVVLDAFPVRGAIGRTALALAFVRRARADGMTVEEASRVVATQWEHERANNPDGGR